MPASLRSLRQVLLKAPDLTGRMLWGARASAALSAIAGGTTLSGDPAALAGATIVLTTASQFAAALALIDLDGLARRIIVCPPDLSAEHLAAISGEAEADALVTDRDPAQFSDLGISRIVACGLPIRTSAETRSFAAASEWVLLTSGTTGAPKMVVHSLPALTGAFAQAAPEPGPPTWATFYDIRRYGGLQIFLRAVIGGTSLVLSEAGEPVADHLHRLAACGATHVSGTPSHWRRALMCSECTVIAPRYVRLSGEIADQAILDALRRQYPAAVIAHAYASTEAGVGFEVSDGREGFPALWLDAPQGGVELKVVEGTLHLRSSRTATRYLGEPAAALLDAEGFVDTGDMIERRGDRCYFVGRRGGIINVGGLKVHPEEVERIINRHDSVKMSRVSARRNPITGAIVVAEVVLNEAASAEPAGDALKRDILQFCRASLPNHKIPALIRFVPSLEVTPAGKLVRQDA